MTEAINHPMLDASTMLDAGLSSLSKSLDLSFREIDSPQTLRDVYKELIEEATETTLDGQPLPRTTYDIVKLNNNYFTSLKGLAEALNEITEVNQIRVLDLSFNGIRRIDDHLSPFSGVKSLYLHGNEISRFQQLQHLSSLPELMNVTLHANPIREKANYRRIVISTLSGLRKLDFSTITRKERQISDYWRRMTDVKLIDENSTSPSKNT